MSDSKNRPHSQVNNPYLPILTALIIMVVFDLLTWERQFGMQFFLLTLMILLGVFILTIFEKKPIPWRSYLLLAPILLGATMTIIQRAGSTTLFNILLTLSALAFFALTLLNGQWIRYRIRDVVLGLLLLIQSALIDPVRAFIQNKQSQSQIPTSEKNTAWNKIRPFLLGLLIAIPLLLIFAALLASADLIFKQRLSNLLDVFKIENIADVIFRTIYILTLGYFLAGAYVHALTYSAEEKNLAPDKPVIKPFLGHVEAFTVLALVNVLFLSFIIIQFRYFFAGTANISTEGFTYAEYARRGFFELVTVAIISLGLFYLLSMFTKRADRTIKRIFSTLGVLLMLQVGCMLISAFLRLSLYEAAYGFTTLRTLTHIFMVWLGALLAAVTLMEVFNQFRRLALVLFLVSFGFTLTLNLLNVDRFIARRNITHTIAGNRLDTNYLLRNLSADGIPTLFKYQQAQDTPQEIQEALTAILACKLALRESTRQEPFWAAWHFAEARADRLFEEHRESLEAYPFNLRSETHAYEQDGQDFKDTYQYFYIEVNGEEIWCMPAD